MPVPTQFVYNEQALHDAPSYTSRFPLPLTKQSGSHHGF